MSVAEMKLAVIKEIGKLEDENLIKEILTLLTNVSEKKGDKTYNLSQHFEAINKQYGKVLEKLAK